jgi:uncharacterized membrane protein YciS (DUF1049 family)
VDLVSEADERLPVGPRGRQGAKGERGERGLSRLQGRAVVFLFGLSVALSACSLFWNSYEVNSNAAAQRSQQASQQQAQRQEQAAQQRAGAAIEAKLCTSLKPLEGLADMKPPAGNPADNPSRAFEQELVVKLAPLAQLGPDLGCKGKP